MEKFQALPKDMLAKKELLFIQFTFTLYIK